LPNRGGDGRITPGNYKVLSNHDGRTGCGSSSGIDNGDGSLGEVGGPFSLLVPLANLDTSEKFALKLDRNNRDDGTLCLADFLGKTILRFLTLLGLGIAGVLIRGSSGRGC